MPADWELGGKISPEQGETKTNRKENDNKNRNKEGGKKEIVEKKGKRDKV